MFRSLICFNLPLLDPIPYQEYFNPDPEKQKRRQKWEKEDFSFLKAVKLLLETIVILESVN